MRFFRAVFLVVLFSSGTQTTATEIIQQEGKWFDCEKSQECTWTKAPCDGPAAVNKNYLKQYELYVNNQQTMIKCGPPPDTNYMKQSKRHVMCNKKKCVIDMPEFKRVP
jgi:hypothetical protein